MCWWYRQARSPSAAPSSACRAARSSSRTAKAAAAVGQIALARAWSEALGAHNITAGQVLVTLGDTEERRRYLNARSTIAKLLEWRSVPVINENDTVATNEIRYGDNDRLAARVATMMSADLLVLLSDIDGLYDKPPAQSADAKLVPVVPRITPEIEAMAGASGSELSRGGMVTKIEAGKIATTAGTHMVIASGHVLHPLQRIADGAPCTWFLTPANPVTSRKKWIAGSLEPRGALDIDAGAVRALRTGKSLLPAGVIKIEGGFRRGDAVVVRGPDGAEIGRGLVAYDADDAGQDQRPLVSRRALDPGLHRPHGNDPSGRSGAGRRVNQRSGPRLTGRIDRSPARHRGCAFRGAAGQRQPLPVRQCRNSCQIALHVRRERRPVDDATFVADRKPAGQTCRREIQIPAEHLTAFLATLASFTNLVPTGNRLGSGLTVRHDSS